MTLVQVSVFFRSPCGFEPQPLVCMCNECIIHYTIKISKSNRKTDHLLVPKKVARLFDYFKKINSVNCFEKR